MCSRTKMLNIQGHKAASDCRFPSRIIINKPEQSTNDTVETQNDQNEQIVSNHSTPQATVHRKNFGHFVLVEEDQIECSNPSGCITLNFFLNRLFLFLFIYITCPVISIINYILGNYDFILAFKIKHDRATKTAFVLMIFIFLQQCLKSSSPNNSTAMKILLFRSSHIYPLFIHLKFRQIT